ncbi:OmpA family protein [Pseudophaeobacter leonis]|uniref:OmpA family protein n=1 Tax=Pseudophaeobacter leonis TaxID=1144477 RepID=UPI001F4E516B|nr:OmpA family protein [Pseudophaeobacter leonis]
MTFGDGNAQPDRGSISFLDNLLDIISRCPDMVIEVGGHTDDVGSAAANSRLSQRRANAVVKYLSAKGIDADRLKPIGYGEADPLVPNTNAQNRAKNRRIDFKVQN